MKVLSMLLLLVFAISVNAQSNDPLVGVESWKALGSRWAVGYDKEAKAIGLFDLSFALPWTRVKIGSVSKRLKAREMVALIRQGEIDGSEAPLTEEENKDLEAARDSESGKELLPQDWAQRIPWKNTQIFSGEAAQFLLSDIDLQRVVSNKKDFERELQNVRDLIATSEDLVGLNDLFVSLEVEKSSAGLNFYYNPAVEVHGVSKPRKIANIKNPKMSFLRALEFELLKRGLGKLTDFIIEPITRAIVETAIDRMLHFLKLVNFSHDHMGLEVLADLTDGNGLLARDLLSAEELVKVAEAIQYADSSLLMSWKWIFKEPYQEWTKSVQKQKDYSQKSQDWFQDHGESGVLLNSRFAVLKNGDLALMSLDKPNKKKGPFRSYVEGRTTPHRTSRIMTEAFTATVVFSTKFVPLVGGLIKDLFKRIIEKPVDKQKYWEARLVAHLEQRQEARSEDWSTEMASLEGQRVNPLFKSREKVMELIRLRKEHFGIH